jgi:hypothetical protein
MITWHFICAIFNRFVYAFEDEIRSAIETAIVKRIMASAEQLDDYLQALPRNLPIDDVSAIDVTILEDPLVNPTFLSVGLKGEFTSLVKPVNFTFPDHGLEPGLFCSDSTKMVTIALMDYVVNSATTVYYEVHVLQTLYLPSSHTHILAIAVEQFEVGVLKWIVFTSGIISAVEQFEVGVLKWIVFTSGIISGAYWGCLFLGGS